MSVNDGIENERQIVANLNSLVYSKLNDTLKCFIEEIFMPLPKEKKQDIISAKRTEDPKYKPDIEISYVNKNKFISVKKGSGNSVHQEPINVFIEYIKNDLHASDEVINSILFFHWGDGTIDGSAPITSRMSASKIIEKYPEKIIVIQDFFNQHKIELLNRFLINGIYNKAPVNVFYYGDYQLADWHTSKEVLEFLCHTEGNALCVGGLTFQNYGRSLNGQDDKRRKSIQLKWPGMSSFFLVGQKSIADIDSKIRGDNSHGFRNVDEIVNSINNITFFNIPNSLKEFIYFIFEGKCASDSIVNATKIVRGKGDMLVWLSEDVECKKNVSIISGSGNSVHQEKVDSFCNYLKEKVHFSDADIKSYLMFHYADGTTNNTGKIRDRLKACEYKNTHHESLMNLQEKMSESKKLIIEHFIKDNSEYGIQDVDFVFYGDTELPYWAKVDTLIDIECTKKPNKRAALAIGDFSIQAWNRSLNGKTEDRRLSMQVKWNNLFQNIQIAQSKDKKTYSSLYKTNKAIEGLTFELEFASEINKDRNHPVWNKLGIHDKNAYIINVSYNQISKIACTRVKPKSDCYVAIIEKKDTNKLDSLNFVISEEYLKTNSINYKPIEHTGISVKMVDSNNYTLQKISFHAFKNVFTCLPPEYFVAALLYVDTEQLQKNKLILSTFNSSIEALCVAVEVSYRGDNELQTVKELKNKARGKIEELVNNDTQIHNMICFGDEIFESPYYADYIFESSKLLGRDEYKKKITVTTGSGRSSGKYTLVFK